MGKFRGLIPEGGEVCYSEKGWGRSVKKSFFFGGISVSFFISSKLKRI